MWRRKKKPVAVEVELETRGLGQTENAILRDSNKEFRSANNMAGTMSRAEAIASISQEERDASERAAEELLKGGGA